MDAYNATPNSRFSTSFLLYVAAVAINYAWEVRQTSLFSGMQDGTNIWWHCFVASLGDGVIVWIIYIAGWAILHRTDWFISPGIKGYTVMLGAGLVIAILIEWVALHILNRWAYTPDMPVIPGINIGITPILQMLILPPIIFYLVAVWFKSTRAQK